MKGGTHLSEEQIKRKRGRPPKSQTVEINSTNISKMNSTQVYSDYYPITYL